MCLDSPGKTLYRAIQERRGILAALVHGVNIIRYRVSLREQGLHHLSTVFVLPVMGEGGGRTRLGKHFGAEKHRGQRENVGPAGGAWIWGRGQLYMCMQQKLLDQSMQQGMGTGRIEDGGNAGIT